MTFVDLPQDEVKQLAGERARAELAAQTLAGDVAPAAPTAGPTPDAPPPEPELTPQAHAASVEMLCSLLVLAGGREVPPARRQIATQLTYEAAKKHGGQIPYFVELCAIGGLGLIVREAFFTKDPTPEQQDKKAA